MNVVLGARAHRLGTATSRRARLTALLATMVMVSAGLLTTVQAGTAAADVQTPGMPTIDITLPAGVTQSTLDGGSKDTVYTQTKISIDDPTNDANDYTTPLNAEGKETGEIKGRGNYTWTLAKKPYQIKLDGSRPVLGMGSAKTWILLANHADASLMRNKVAYDFAASLGLPGSPDSRWVDLRINGQYRGNYLITEKVEVKTNRVELTDPKGILTEMDRRGDGLCAGCQAEDYYHYSGTTKTIFTLKDSKSGTPDVVGNWSQSAATLETKAGWDDMRATIDKLDAALNASSPSWTTISSLIDVDSFVKYYFVFELAENPEIVQSSVYFYKNGPTDKLHAGPVWDFDSALANYDKSEPYGADYRSEYVKNAQALRQKGNGWMTQIFRNRAFVERANALWKSEVAYHAHQLPSKIDGYYNEVKNSAANNFARWPILGKPTLLVAGEGKTYATTYAGEYTYLKNWVVKRETMLRKLYGDSPIVRSRPHVQSYGWRPWVNSGQFVGTTGLAKRLEAFNLYISNNYGVSGSIQANAHVQSIGWQGYKTLGSSTLVGTTGRALRIEAVQFRLTGALATTYDVSYRAHVQGYGWMPWQSNGVTAGTTGKALRVEAIQVRLARKTAPTPTNPVP